MFVDNTPRSRIELIEVAANNLKNYLILSIIFSVVAALDQKV